MQSTAPLVLFDIDGTLTRNKPGVSYQILSTVFENVYNVQLEPEHIGTLAGKTDKQIHRAIAETIGIEPSLMQDSLPIALEILANTTGAIASKDTIIELQGGKALINELQSSFSSVLGLLTGNVKESAYHKLKPFNLDIYFPFGAFGDDHENRTELPPIAIERATLYYKGKTIFSPYSTVIIGDAPGDIECAQAHDIAVICVATGKHSAEELRDLGADIVFDTLSDTQQILQTVASLLQ